MLTFVLYSRPGCHLCEILADDLLPLLRDLADLEVCDIDSRPEWREKYDVRIPVLAFQGQEICHYRLDSSARQRVLQIVADVGADKGNHVA